MNELKTFYSPTEYISTFEDVELWVKRDDLIHPYISGNKWRKLKYYLEDFRLSGKNRIATFGGAFSNHITATAALGRLLNISTTGYIRGEEVVNNPSLSFARSCGMQIMPISRENYRLKDSPDFINELVEDDEYIIPEGGKGPLGVKGCMEILHEVEPGFDVVCCAAGTATTFAGLLLSGYQSDYRMYPALKGAEWLRKEMEGYCSDFLTTNNGKKSGLPLYGMSENYHFGGFGKVREDLLLFMNSFYEEHGILLDPLYTGKMFYGIMEEIRLGVFKSGSRILAIHSGGLQGIKGMNERLKKTANTMLYEK